MHCRWVRSWMRGWQVHEGKGGNMGEGKKKERRKSLLRIRRKKQEDSTYARPRSIPVYPTSLSQLLSVGAEPEVCAWSESGTGSLITEVVTVIPWPDFLLLTRKGRELRRYCVNRQTKRWRHPQPGGDRRKRGWEWGDVGTGCPQMPKQLRREMICLPLLISYHRVNKR